jgi:hypothetical protein
MVRARPWAGPAPCRPSAGAVHLPHGFRHCRLIRQQVARNHLPELGGFDGDHVGDGLGYQRATFHSFTSLPRVSPCRDLMGTGSRRPRASLPCGRGACVSVWRLVALISFPPDPSRDTSSVLRVFWRPAGGSVADASCPFAVRWNRVWGPTAAGTWVPPPGRGRPPGQRGRDTRSSARWRRHRSRANSRMSSSIS